MTIDNDFIKCRDGGYIARRLVARIEVKRDDRGLIEHVLFDDRGDEIGRTSERFLKSTLVPAVGWTYWIVRFDLDNLDEKWTRRAEPVVAWEVGAQGCHAIGASCGYLRLTNILSERTEIFRYLEESREGRRRFWANRRGGTPLYCYENISELDVEIKSFIQDVVKRENLLRSFRQSTST